ncbi:WD40-repeat-containing domain protein [Gilbertella persicaria]|uniref:WD40-repeat-containing domain protein n=1 Tax=Gilbertella persicaria TaxID=101096 RepID=UPI00221F3B8E|nr:WD40-repeat-containing domain protein [Gilbertella persicaria]KAI8090980.1 WD40-repeat-containing domain protein [Gilbertella persicaria]
MSVPSHQVETPMGSPSRPSNNDINHILQNYFVKKGFHQGEYAFIQQQEPSSDHNIVSLDQLTHKFKSTIPTEKTCLPDYVESIKQDPAQADAESAIAAYDTIREWILSALDIYKSDLYPLLYPLFIYTFLDLKSAGRVEHAHQLLENYKHDHLDTHKEDIEIMAASSTPSHLETKYSIRIPSIPFELFFQYIKDKQLSSLIRIVKHHLNIHIITGKLTPASAGGSMDEDVMNVDMAKVKKEEEEIEDDTLLDTVHLPTHHSADIQAELESLSDLRKRVALGSAALPSVCLCTFYNTHNQLNCITISKDATLVAGGFSESFIKIWSLKGKKLQGKLEQEGTDYKKLIGHSGPIYGISFSHDNKYLISCSEDQTVRLWCLETYKNVVVYKSHNYPIWDIDFGPYGFYFATASHDRTARLWSCDHVNPLRIFAGHLSDVNTVRFHPNSKYVVTGSSDRTARLWDVQRGSCVRVFTGHTGSIHTVAVSPNGRLMASGGEDKSIILWDLGTGKKLKSMTGHTGFIYSVSFNSDSTVLVSGSADGTVRVWDVNKDTPYDTRNADIDPKRTKYDKVNGKQKEKKELDKIKAVMDLKKKKSSIESHDHLSVFPTKNTPIYTVQFTQRNLCLAAGAFASPSIDF